MNSQPKESAELSSGNGRKPRFSVLIVNYNGGTYVKDALESLTRQSRRDFEVILIDNASTDGSVDELETSLLPAFTLLSETENHGYAGGMNRAAAHAQGDWLVGLNPDAVATPTWLEKIATGIARHPDAKMFASAQFALEAPDTLDGAGDAYLIIGIPWRGGFGRPASELPGEGECFSPCGAGGVFERETFLRHDGFDERFFCFCEDVDLGFRLRLAGETCIFLPDAVIHHVGGGISGRSSDFSIYHGFRNRIWTYAKNMPSVIFWLTLPAHIGLSLYLLARAFMTGRLRQTWRGMRDGLAGAVSMRRSGQELRRTRRVALWPLARSMAWNPFRMSSHRVHVRQNVQASPLNGPNASEAL